MKEDIFQIKVNGCNFLRIKRHKRDFLFITPPLSVRTKDNKIITNIFHNTLHTDKDRFTFKITDCKIDGKSHIDFSHLFLALRNHPLWATKVTPKDIDLFREIDVSKHKNYKGKLEYVISYAINLLDDKIEDFIGDSKKVSTPEKNFIIPKDKNEFCLRLYIGKNCPQKKCSELTSKYLDYTIVNCKHPNGIYTFLFGIQYKFPKTKKRKIQT